MEKEESTRTGVSRVALEDIIDADGCIAADGIIIDDVVSESLAVLLPAGTSLNVLKETYPRIMLQLSRHGVTHLKIKNFEQQVRAACMSAP